MNDFFTFEAFMMSYHKVSIPMLQRDYVQGRTRDLKLSWNHENPIRKPELADNILAALNNDKVILLDFIYGITTLHESKSSFEPIDGQQRLTTLWLIHWFIYWKLGGEDLHKYMENFSYLTRWSTRDFIRQMVEKIETIVASDEQNDNALSTAIRSQVWFRYTWNKDASVLAMLNMLDYINWRVNSSYKNNIKNFKNKLKNIKFRVLKINDMGLDDTLYVKMNGRGKILTPFENFKADLLNYIKEREWKDLYNAYSDKLDNDWLDLFWSILENQDTAAADKNYFKFINRFLSCDYFVEAVNKKIATPDSLAGSFNEKSKDEYKIITGGEMYLNFSLYIGKIDFGPKHEIITDERLRRLENVLNGFCSKKTRIELYPWGTSGKELQQHMFTYTNDNMKRRCMEYALCRFICDKGTFCEEDNQDFNDWRRVIWNILTARNITGIKDAIESLLFIDGICPTSFNNFNKTLLEENKVVDKDGTLELEKIKAHLRNVSRDNNQDDNIGSLECNLNKAEKLLNDEWLDYKKSEITLRLDKQHISLYFIIKRAVNEAKGNMEDITLETIKKLNEEELREFSKKFIQIYGEMCIEIKKMYDSPKYAICKLLRRDILRPREEGCYLYVKNGFKEFDDSIFSDNNVKKSLWSICNDSNVNFNDKPWLKFLTYLCKGGDSIEDSADADITLGKCLKGHIRCRDRRLEISKSTQWTVGEKGWLTRDMWDAGQDWIMTKLRKRIDNTKFDLNRPNFLESITSTRIFKKGETAENYIVEIKWSGTQYSWYRRDHNEPIKEDDNLDDLDQILKKLIKEDMKEHIDRLNEFWLQQDS